MRKNKKSTEVKLMLTCSKCGREFSGVYWKKEHEKQCQNKISKNTK